MVQPNRQLGEADTIIVMAKIVMALQDRLNTKQLNVRNVMHQRILTNHQMSKDSWWEGKWSWWTLQKQKIFDFKKVNVSRILKETRRANNVSKYMEVINTIKTNWWKTFACTGLRGIKDKEGTKCDIEPIKMKKLTTACIKLLNKNKVVLERKLRGKLRR